MRVIHRTKRVEREWETERENEEREVKQTRNKSGMNQNTGNQTENENKRQADKYLIPVGKTAKSFYELILVTKTSEQTTET